MADAAKPKQRVTKKHVAANAESADVVDETPERAQAEVGLSAMAANAETARLFAKGFVGDVQIGEAIDVLHDKIRQVKGGDLSEVEATLTAQAIALDAIFNGLAKRAVLHMGAHMGACETYLRLALKAQAQCRATLETLAEVKYPRVPTFVRQQNVACQQQVNNGASATAGNQGGTRAHTINAQSKRSKLLEDQCHGSAYLDTGATKAAGSRDPALEAVGAIHRTDKRRG